MVGGARPHPELRLKQAGVGAAGAASTGGHRHAKPTPRGDPHTPLQASRERESLGGLPRPAQPQAAACSEAGRRKGGPHHCGGFREASPQQGPVLRHQGGSEGLETKGDQSGTCAQTGQHGGGPLTAWTSPDPRGQFEAAQDCPTEAGRPELPRRTQGYCLGVPLTGHVAQVTVHIQLCQPRSALASHLHQRRLQVGEISGVDADLQTPTGWTNVSLPSHAQRTRVGRGTVGRRRLPQLPSRMCSLKLSRMESHQPQANTERL